MILQWFHFLGQPAYTCRYQNVSILDLLELSWWWWSWWWWWWQLELLRRAKLQPNRHHQHPAFYRPDAILLLNQQCQLKALEAESITFHALAVFKLTCGSSIHPCHRPLKAPGYLGCQACLLSALWRQNHNFLYCIGKYNGDCFIISWGNYSNWLW